MGQTADEHQQPSQRRSVRPIQSSISHLSGLASEPKKKLKPKKKAFHAPYQKLIPIFTDDIQNIDAEASDSSVRNSPCVDVPVGIFPLFCHPSTENYIALCILYRCWLAHLDMHRA
jgi:hypothetical protein